MTADLPQWTRPAAEAAIADALQALAEAANAAAAPTLPQAPFPRPPRWWGCAFPAHRTEGSRNYWLQVEYSPEGQWRPYRRVAVWYLSCGKEWHRQTAAEIVGQDCQPTRVLRALRALERDTRWLVRAAAARQRMAQEILRQQAAAAEQITARGVASAL